MTLVLGVDSGGTSTRAAIADANGVVLGTGAASAGNLDDVGAQATASAIAAAAADALRAAGAVTDDIGAAFLGVAGVVSAADRDAVLDAVAPLSLAPRERTQVDHDCRVALAGALSGRPGIVLIAGTGSAAFGIDAGGARWRAGGWGALLGDEGSSFRIAVQGLRAVSMAADGRGPETSLTPALLGAVGADQPDDLMHRLHVDGLDRSVLASLAPLVLSAATSGDQVAEDILNEAVEQLAQLVATVRGRLTFEAPAPVAYVGGLFNAGEVVLTPLRAALGRLAPDVTLTAAETDPVAGACLLAAERLRELS